MSEEKKTKTAPKDIMGFLDYYLVGKAPFQIPEKGKEWIVKYGPWITIVLLVLSLPALLFILGLGTLFMPLGGYGYATGFGLAAIVLIVQLGLQVAALPGLFARKMSGWTLLFYADIISFAYSIIQGQYFSSILSVVIGLYILFQIRGKYTK